MVVTLSSKKRSKLVKIINTVFFTLIQMLFALFIYIVEFNNIDISTNTNLYTNEQTLTLLEFGMGLFVVWILLLLVIFYLKKADKIFKVKSDESVDDYYDYINDFNEPVRNNTNVDQVTNKKKKVKVKKNKNKIVDEEVVPVNVSSSVSNSFNNDVVQSLVPEVGLFDTNDEEVILVDDFNTVSNNGTTINNSINNNLNEGLNSTSNNLYTNNDLGGFTNVNQNSNNSFDVFSNFEFLNVPNNQLDRKNNDVEVIDFDS